MAVRTSPQIKRGDRVAILPRDGESQNAKTRFATVTYVGPVYLRLSDGSTYAVMGLTSLRGNENTRIELACDD